MRIETLRRSSLYARFLPVETICGVVHIATPVIGTTANLQRAQQMKCLRDMVSQMAYLRLLLACALTGLGVLSTAAAETHPVSPMADHRLNRSDSTHRPQSRLQISPPLGVGAPNIVPSNAYRPTRPTVQAPRRDLFGAPAIDGSPSPTDLVVAENLTSPLPSPTLPRPDVESSESAATRTADETPSLSVWWTPHITEPSNQDRTPKPITINELIAAALQYSAQVRVISETPLIRDTLIVEEEADFDWTAFMDTRWDDILEPVGNELDTGGPPSLSNELFDYSIGTRRKIRSGGRFEISQKYGYNNSNSIFQVSNPQGTSRLSLSFTQPLMRGAGRFYNTRLVVLAMIDAAAARDGLSRELQRHLLEVTRSYWNLYFNRGVVLQRQRLYGRARNILEELEHRQSIDALKSQIIRVRAAVTARQADLLRTAAQVKDNEAQLRALINDPHLGRVDQFELIPQDAPINVPFPVSMQGSLSTAIRERPEINEALKRIKAAALELNVARNELLPALDLVLESYVNGLRGNTDIGGALRDQFGDGAPSYAAGLQFSVPLGNRAARARQVRRKLELRQFQGQFRQIVGQLEAEVEVTVREVETAYREMMAKYVSMNAAATEVEYITQRWRVLAGVDRSAALLLEDLLVAQEQLAIEEYGFLEAQVNYNLSLTELRRAEGTLLQWEGITPAYGTDCHGTPFLEQLRSEQTAGREDS